MVIGGDGMTALAPQILTRLSRYRADDLGPHAAAILAELQRAAAVPLPLTIVTLAAALVDIVAHEAAGPSGYLDGAAFAYAGNKAALGWLRGRRNSILHHEAPSDGLMGEGEAVSWQMADAERAIHALLDYLEDISIEDDGY
ncbi:hypothetical protein [Candidatus Puniceispirillum sp.]|uniref:hypothetical protein n=1 Tax=Candidatus Puniceispirillum sp. TaxID=2026719 RepID=UPI002FCE02F9